MMKNSNYSAIIYAVVVLITMNACSKKEILGPSIVPLYTKVEITEAFSASDKNPDFTKISVMNFSAKFTNQASWILTLKGEKSGAIYTQSGVSSALDITNAKWDGRANSLPSFEIEKVTALLVFVNTNDTLKTEINLIGKVQNLNQGLLISDFASAAKIGSSWPKDWPAITNANNSYTKPDGNNYLMMSGKPWQGNPVSAYVNFLKIPANQADGAAATDTYFPLIYDPSRVYFNISVYATETPNTWLKIIFLDETGNRVIDIRPDWIGWKLISVKYSDLLLDGPGSEVGDPSKITAVQFVLLSDAVPAESANVSTAFDHPIFTVDKPYQP